MLHRARVRRHVDAAATGVVWFTAETVLVAAGSHGVSPEMATDLARIREMIGGERGLATVSTVRSDGSVHSAVVNAGVTTHPVTGEEVAGYVALGRALKLRHLRSRPLAAVTWRVGFRWQTVEGAVTLIGPDDPLEGVDPAQLPQLLRDVYLSTGATHDDWPTYDRVMAEERRCIVLVRPERVYGAG